MTAKKNGSTKGAPPLPPEAEHMREVDETILTSSEGGYFAADNAWVRGVLLNIDARELTDKRTGEVKSVDHYVLETVGTPEIDDGSVVIVRESTDLAKKVKPDMIGHIVIFQRTDQTIPSKIKGNNPMVVWKVLVGDKADSDKLSQIQRESALRDGLSV